MQVTVQALIDRLRSTSATELLEIYDHLEHVKLWNQDPRGPQLYRAFARRLLDQGHPTLALNLARRGLDAYANDVMLCYLVALAYARGGNSHSAEIFLEALLEKIQVSHPSLSGGAPASFFVDVLALRGRLQKDRYRQESDPELKKRFARRSADCYLEAANVPQSGSYPLINAATMRFLEGKIDEARQLAQRVLEHSAKEIAAGDSASSYWSLAAAGEANLLLEHHDEALRFFEDAVDQILVRSELGSLVSILGNLHLLAEAGVTERPVWLEKKLGSVIAFSGHRIDAPDRSAKGLPPRFPNDLALGRRVQRLISEHLAKVNARFGFSSLACGSDILFAEAMLERKAELQVVLPFALKDFLLTSVDYGLLDDPRMCGWKDRFLAILSKLRSDQIHFATTEPYLSSDRLFQYANEIIQGMAMVRANQLNLEPRALIVLDPLADNSPGGTRHFLEHWQHLDRVAEVIDLSRLKIDVPSLPVRVSEKRERSEVGELPRPIRSMLFADVAGFSMMKEEYAPRFISSFTRELAEVLIGAGESVLLANTWGDGFFAVFERAPDCARFALQMLHRLHHTIEWGKMGFPDPNPVRVGLHCGPVFELANDPVLKRRNFFGNHVNRTARIEPATMPGCAYASEQFAALLTVHASHAYKCEFIGIERLPKQAGNYALYRIGAIDGPIAGPPFPSPKTKRRVP